MIYFYFLTKYWREVDRWLYDNFGFGVYELADLAKGFLIEVTR